MSPRHIHFILKFKGTDLKTHKCINNIYIYTDFSSDIMHPSPSTHTHTRAHAHAHMDIDKQIYLRQAGNSWKHMGNKRQKVSWAVTWRKTKIEHGYDLICMYLWFIILVRFRFWVDLDSLPVLCSQLPPLHALWINEDSGLWFAAKQQRRRWSQVSWRSSTSWTIPASLLCTNRSSMRKTN